MKLQGPLKYHCAVNPDGTNNGSVFREEFPGMAHCVCKAPRYVSKEEWENTARFITAAPDMYEALKDFVDACEHAPPVELLQYIDLACKKAKSAIDKAEGRS